MKKIKKVQDGIWKTDSEKYPYQLDFRPNGHNGKRFKKGFLTLGEARRFMNHKISLYSGMKEWEPDPDDNRRLDVIIALWHKLHGKSLSDERATLKKLNNICKNLNNPIARKLTPTIWTNYRSLRLEKVSIKTVNNEQKLIKAIYNELIRLDELKENPIKNVRMLKYKQPEMGFFTKKEINDLLNELKKSKNIDAYYITKIALSTGCRWSEAENLTDRNIADNLLTFTKTKNGQNRSVPISNELKAEIPIKKGRLFKSCMSIFRKVIEELNINLPKGQSTHALRHTFASHFMMKGGNILVLQQILGHASITETMKYSHFSKTHLQDAIKFNPLSMDV